MVDMNDVRLEGANDLKGLLVIRPSELIAIELFKFDARNADDPIFLGDLIVERIGRDDQAILPMHLQSHAEIEKRSGNAIDLRWISVGKKYDIHV